MKKILFMIILMLTLAACSGEVNVNEFDYPVDTYESATVTEVSTEEYEAVMTIVVEGFRGDITVRITVIDDTITDFIVIEHEESDDWGKILIEDTSFIADIIEQSSNLNTISPSNYTVDADGGATASATGQALLNAAETALAHYQALYEKTY